MSFATPESAVAAARELAKGFADTAERHDRTGEFPFANFERLRAAGLLNLTVPAIYGGSGLGLGAASGVIGTIAAGEPSTALVLAMQYLFQATIARNAIWPEHIRERLARESVAGMALINALRVEPELGTPARGGLPATTATRTADGWRLAGRKIYATGIPVLRWLAVWARTADTEPEVGWWLVPAAAPGVSVIETWDHVGMRATASHDVQLDGVAVPADHAVDIRPPSAWGAPDADQAAWNAVIISALYDGIARAARDWLVGYLNARVPSNLGAPLASLPRFQAAVGEIEGLLLTNDRLLGSAAADVDEGRGITPSDVGLIKLAVTGNAIRAVESGLALIGNPGLSRHNPLERHYRDVLCSRIHTPQNDTILNAAGRLALGV
jgi:alkylation response protein AidB-like acyl-CoA dehydrogenase